MARSRLVRDRGIDVESLATVQRPAGASLTARVLTMAAALSTSACVSVPRAAPDLAAQLGARIQESRTAHQAVVRLYMAEKRQAVDQFVDTEWVPHFAERLFDQPPVAAEWQRIVRSDSDTDRLEFIRRLGPMLQSRINAKRQELIQPLDEAERAILSALDEHYAEMIAINSNLIGLLEAASEGSERQSQIIERIDPGGRLPGMLQKAEEITGLLVDKLDGYDRHRETIDSLIAGLRNR